MLKRLQLLMRAGHSQEVPMVLIWPWESFGNLGCRLRQVVAKGVLTVFKHRLIIFL